MNKEELYNEYNNNFNKEMLIQRIIGNAIEVEKILKQSNKLTKKDIIKKLEFILCVLEMKEYNE